MSGAVGAGVLRSPAKVKGSMFFSKTQYKYQSSGNITIVILLCNILLFANKAITGLGKRIMKKLLFVRDSANRQMRSCWKRDDDLNSVIGEM